MIPAGNLLRNVSLTLRCVRQLAGYGLRFLWALMSPQAVLAARLLQLRRKEREEELQAAYDARGQIAWGNQIRSYVLQPYTLVKDHRTSMETGKVQAVLDGEIDFFIEAYLRRKVAGAGKKAGP